MKRIVGWLGVVSGTIFSAIGVIVSACMVCGPACGTSACCVGPVLAVSGPLVGILGVELSGFLHNYRWLLIGLGIIFFGVGIFLIIRKKKCCATNGLNSQELSECCGTSSKES